MANSVLEISYTLSYVLLPLGDFNLYPFTIINHNCENNILTEFDGSFQRIIEPVAHLRTPADVVTIRIEMDLADS